MNETCVDASMIVKLVLRSESMRDKARRLVQDAGLTSTLLIAPPVFESEIDSIIRRRVHEGRLTEVQARLAYGLLDALPIRILNPPELRTRAREIAAQYGQRAVYDSTYAALAELRGCDFWTADKAYYDIVHADLPFVQYLADYP